MTGNMDIIKHLEMIQGIINRLAGNSFLIKGWSMTILVAALIFVSRSPETSKYFFLAFAIPVFGFWILDAYFLQAERIFRGIYDDVRQQSKTNFEMDIAAQRHKPECAWKSVFLSKTLLIFYLIQLIFVAFGFLVL